MSTPVHKTSYLLVGAVKVPKYSIKIEIVEYNEKPNHVSYRSVVKTGYSVYDENDIVLHTVHNALYHICRELGDRANDKNLFDSLETEVVEQADSTETEKQNQLFKYFCTMSADASTVPSEFYYTQDPIITFQESYPEMRNKFQKSMEKKEKNIKKFSKLKDKNKRNITKNNGMALSYIKFRGSKKGHHLIKIKIYDICDRSIVGKGQDLNAVYEDSEDDAVLSAQYVAVHPVDEILDESKYLVSKICKTLSGDNAL